MTIPPVSRVFFAIDLPAETKKKIGRFIGDMKKKSKSNAIRWSKPDNLHITLQFLAEVKTEHLPVLIDNVRAEMEGALKNTTITVGALHLFPNPYRPRVIVAEITPQEELAMISGLIGLGIKATQYEIENRPFRAHLTLGRIKHAQGVNLSFLSECRLPDIEQILVEEVVLFRSDPLPEGSQYTVLERITLHHPASGMIFSCK